MIKTWIISFLSLNLVLWGCAGKPNQRSHHGRAKNYHQGAELARKHFQAGKQHYLLFRFSESIQELKRAIELESSNTRKALCLLYIGASYFYLEDTRKALQSFVLAKKHHRSVRPDRSEFPMEIIRLYERAQ